ncbi:hypothetical protein [Paenibacillus durus]|uniref:hypothetical protein n=1 Tax=Paenibacillus durus TaxID=44251 RepID=UPI0012E06084|nr:hypothetical protein [Paenibacillus durus]
MYMIKIHGLILWDSSHGINPSKSGHHLVYAGKAKSIALDHLASYQSTPTFFFKETYVEGPHERIHAAQKPHVGPRQGRWKGTAEELFEASKKGLKDVDDIYRRSKNSRYW